MFCLPCTRSRTLISASQRHKRLEERKGLHSVARFYKKLLKNIFLEERLFEFGLIELTFFCAFVKLIFTIFCDSSHFFT